MKKICLLMLAFSAVLFAGAQNEMVVDPNAEVRTLDGSFSAIKVSGGIEIYLSQSDNEAIAVSAAAEKIREGIKTTIENGLLRIYYVGDRLWSMGNKKLKAYVAFKKINKLEASGASDIRVSGNIMAEDLVLHLTGASDFKGNVTVKSLKMDLSGASDVTISGTAGTVQIESSGASDVKGYGLSSEVCTARASGASDINITVSKELTASASGASDISYRGTGLLKEMHSSGASSIQAKK